MINNYAAKVGITLKQKYDAENISGGTSLVVSTGCVTLLPLYVLNMLIPSVVARPRDASMTRLATHGRASVRRRLHLLPESFQRDLTFCPTTFDQCMGSFQVCRVDLAEGCGKRRAQRSGID